MLFLTEEDVQELLPMERALECVTSSLLAQHAGAINRSRQRIFLPNVSLHYMAAGLPDHNLIGMKIYTVAGPVFRFLVLLYDGESGGLLSVLEADHLGRLRTGAASGVATRHMATAEASRLGLIGTGRQARTQLQAVAQVRKLQAALVFSRDPGRRKTFAQEMTTQLGFPVKSVDTAEAAVRSADIVITATNSREPVLEGEWLRPGTHINAIGANMPNRRELDDRVLARSAIIAVDTIDQAKEEAGDLVHGLRTTPGGWGGVVELHQIVSGSQSGRHNDEEITMFKSSGIALWDVAVAGYVYRQAIDLRRGREILDWAEYRPRAAAIKGMRPYPES